jgi:hypothetical protein
MDGTNKSAYILSVTDGGLSDNAVLTATTYTVAVDGATGTITGMALGTTLADVIDDVVVPPGAAMNIVDAEDAFVALKALNYDTVYVDVLASENVFFEVIAEDGHTTILYQLIPDHLATDAFVLSTAFEIDQTAKLIKHIPRDVAITGFLDELIAAPGATLKLIDKMGFERTWGPVYQDDKLIVTAEDAVTTATYFLYMLPENDLLLPVDYLAYVLSDVYSVDQEMMMIDGETVTNQTTVTDFIANLIPAAGATLAVVDADGVATTSATLMVDDQLMVTAADGMTMAYYDIDVIPLSVEGIDKAAIKLYPNPSTGTVYISGLEIGNRVRVYNSLGMNVRDLVAYQSNEVISLDGQSSGMYFVVVSNKDSIIGNYKLIKK